MSQSPLSSAHLRHTPERFENIFGLSVSDFDALLLRLSVPSDNAPQNQPDESDLAEEVNITLLSMRQSTTHAVLGVCFGREESVVGDIVTRLQPRLEAVQAHHEKDSSKTRPHNQKENQPENIDETLRLLQELQIYQVELKAQNAELQTSREDTEAQLRRYTHLFEFAPMGYFKVARDGRTIQQANLAAERLFGLSRSEFLHQPLARFIAEDSRPMINDVLTKVFAQEIGGVPERCEVKMLYREQKPFWVFIEAILNENGQLCRLAVLDITERKQVEEILQESNQKMHLIFETMSEGVALNEVVYDEAGEMINYRILEVNAAYKTTADYLGEVIIGQLATDLYGLSQQTITDFWMEAQNRTTVLVLEYFSPHRRRWFETTISPIVNHRFVTTVFDITERKETQEKLRKTEENQQRILETMGVGVTVTRNGQMLFANESWCKLIGYTAEEIRSFDFYDTIHPVSRQLIRERGLARMRGEDVPDRYETQFCHKNGATLWIDISAFLIEYEGMTAVISTMVDITERKRAESLLASSEERYRLFVELQGTYFLRTDLDGKYTYASPAHTQTFGLGKTSVIGVFGLDHIIPEDHDKTQATVEQCLQSPGTPIPVVLRKPSATGQILWTEWEFIAIQNSEGSVTEIQCVGHDITERKLVEEALHELNQTLEQRVERRTHELVLLNNEKNEFLGIAAHDLKNPLSGILTSAEILERYYGGEVRTKRYLSMIVSASEQMLDIIENLLDVNKIESGHVKVNIAPISLSVVSAVVDDYIQRATSKGIILRYDPVPDESVPTVLADEQALWQVLDNLVSNAVKYSPRWKSISVRTLNRTDAKGKHFGRVEIQDQGPGISEADMHKLFQKFTRLTAQPTAGENSTGLGLSIVKKLVELQQGKVWCESELGKGATFIVEFPSA